MVHRGFLQAEAVIMGLQPQHSLHASQAAYDIPPHCLAQLWFTALLSYIQEL